LPATEQVFASNGCSTAGGLIEQAFVTDVTL